jgi:signal transduction histidine kinase
VSIVKKIERKPSGSPPKEKRSNLKQQNEPKIESIAVIVHELRTLLTPLRASSELLFQELERQPDSPEAKLVQNIVAGARGLEHWVSEMQEILHSEAGILKVKLETVAPLTVLSGVASECLPMMKFKKQSLILDLPAFLPPVWGDVERLREVLINLLVNASRYTSEKGEILLRARATGNEVTVEVQDNGTGIPKAKRKHLFESRFRIRSQQREEHKGLGLGLAICQQLVQLHGGRIWVDSEPGRGSTFAFTLPISKERN